MKLPVLSKKHLGCSLFAVCVLLLIAPVSLNAQGWTLVWSDEFNGPANSLPDATKWTYDVGGGGWGNNEEEIYCAAGSNVAPCNSSNPNSYMDGKGHLIIKAIYDGTNWTSARMKTQGVENFQYGRIEARMKLPKPGAGIWPAFWMLGDNINTSAWPLCGETDIMEWVPQFGSSFTSATIHGPFSDGNGVGSGYTFPNGETVDGEFHTYGMTWTPTLMQFYRDDPTNIFFSIANTQGIPGDWVFNHPFFIIMNLAMGGYFPGYTDPTTPNPSVMTVDYVRVYRASNQLASGPIAIDAGGPTAGPYYHDTNYVGGSIVGTANPIDTSLIPPPVPPQAVYQTVREEKSKYTVTGLVPGAPYNVQLQFADWQSTGPGERRFNVLINGKQVLTNFDIFAATGAQNKAIEENFTANADPLSGNITVNLTQGAAGQPIINGISVTQQTDNPPTSGSVSIDSGAGWIGNFIADTDFTGGNSATSFATVDMSLIPAPVPPQAVFQSERWAPTTYTMGGFVPGSNHTVNLYFNEIYWTAPGQRQFNVLINGVQVLTNFDIIGATGAQNRAIEKSFSATANGSGQIVVQTTIGAADQPKISGLTVN